MAERRLPTQRDITRALKAAKAAGFPEPRVEIEPDGKLVIITAPEPDDTREAGEWQKRIAALP